MKGCCSSSCTGSSSSPRIGSLAVFGALWQGPWSCEPFGKAHGHVSPLAGLSSSLLLVKGSSSTTHHLPEALPPCLAAVVALESPWLTLAQLLPPDPAHITAFTLDVAPVRVGTRSGSPMDHGLVKAIQRIQFHWHGKPFCRTYRASWQDPGLTRVLLQDPSLASSWLKNEPCGCMTVDASSFKQCEF